MTSIPLPSPDFEEPWVALDLETTGLSNETDRIIEVGAVKFVGEHVLDTFQTFVNPKRRLSDFIRQYTGITQQDVSGAPSFREVSGPLKAFVGSSPVVGHNVGFDLGFLRAGGLGLSNPQCDTYDLAFVLVPGAGEYNLSGLAEALGVPHDRAHRADADATMVQGVFVKLEEMAQELDVNTVSEMRRLAGRSSWVLDYFLRSLEAKKLRAGIVGSAGPAEGSSVGISGVDLRAVGARLRHGRSLKPSGVAEPVDPDFVVSLLQEDSPLARSISGFEEREEQIVMARAVADAINGGQRLIVEAGTGVGKSLAYLLPAALYALRNGKRIVVSTNTINLQEQLIGKDLPTLAEAMSNVEDFPVEDLKFTQLKGRANYLCLKRFGHLRSADNVSVAEARMLAKSLVWLQSTATGDRSELNLSRRDTAIAWDRLSAQGALRCPTPRGPCFLRAARERAAASHLVVVNHALLLSDLTAGGTLIPSYDILIVDEAHHLENEATNRLGFEVGQTAISDRLQTLAGERGVLREVAKSVMASGTEEVKRKAVEHTTSQVVALLPAVRERLSRLFATMYDVLYNDVGDESQRGGQSEVRITSGTRTQPGWSEVETQWHGADVAIAETINGLRSLQAELESLRDARIVNYEGLVIELANELQVAGEVRQMLTEIVPHPQDNGVYWSTLSRRDGGMTLHAAPLSVSEQLEDLLYSKKDSVIFTSATLSAGGTFKHILDRTGFADAEEVLLGSPFDYEKAAMVCVPDDMPEPSSWAYPEAVGQAVMEAVEAAGGRTMALFTSHASLQATASSVRPYLESQGFDVFAQGVDGSPHRILRKFLENPRSLLLGTASFWEGVDLAGESLQVLLMARLPFNVPTEPVFAARSELFERPFIEYALPQAILRLRQGFGRLIRTRTDEGVVVILDKRLTSRGYGREFLKSLPPMTVKTCNVLDIGDEVKGWIGGGRC